MDKEKLKIMKNCSHLLPDPGGEVVRECIEEIKVITRENELLTVQLDSTTKAFFENKQEIKKLKKKFTHYAEITSLNVECMKEIETLKNQMEVYDGTLTDYAISINALKDENKMLEKWRSDIVNMQNKSSHKVILELKQKIKALEDDIVKLKGQIKTNAVGEVHIIKGFEDKNKILEDEIKDILQEQIDFNEEVHKEVKKERKVLEDKIKTLTECTCTNPKEDPYGNLCKYCAGEMYKRVAPKLSRKNKALMELLREIQETINNSSGVDGWHLNGDIANWDEFEFVEKLSKALQGEKK